MAKSARRSKRIDGLQRVLMGQRELLGMTYDDLAAAAGVSKSTAHRLLHEPESMSLSQLRAFCRALQLQPDDVRGLLPLQ